MVSNDGTSGRQDAIRPLLYTWRTPSLSTLAGPHRPEHVYRHQSRLSSASMAPLSFFRLTTAVTSPPRNLLPMPLSEPYQRALFPTTVCWRSLCLPCADPHVLTPTHPAQHSPLPVTAPIVERKWVLLGDVPFLSLPVFHELVPAVACSKSRALIGDGSRGAASH